MYRCWNQFLVGAAIITAADATASASLLPQSTIKALQQALKRQDGALKTDGVLGKGTRAAIRRYQAQRGLQVTGEPDAATLSRLGVPWSATLAPTQVAKTPSGSPPTQGQPAAQPIKPEQMQALQSMLQNMQGQMQMIQSMVQMMRAQLQPERTDLGQMQPGPR
jgi:peptidoglycan hydrolase-like protein with peptidoglycan-binding domain